MILRTRGYPPQDDTWLFADTLADHQTRKRVSSTSAPVPERSPFGQPSGGPAASPRSTSRAARYLRINARVHGHTIRCYRAASPCPSGANASTWGSLPHRTCPLRKTESPAPAWRAPGMPAPTGCSSTEFAPRHPTSQVMLEEQGLRVDVIARREIPFGPVLTARRRMLASRGIITADQRSEVIVVIRGRQHA